MSISKHLDKNNLHHAYLLEGDREHILPEILEFTQGEELIQIHLDSFKMDDARELKSLGVEKANTEGKKIFIISTNLAALLRDVPGFTESELQ